MAAKKTQEIAGLPVEKFLNRRVRLKNEHGRHMKSATLTGLGETRGKVLVKPDNHKGEDLVLISRVHPWWSQNPDLKEEHDAMVAANKVEEVVDPPEPEEEPSTEAVPTILKPITPFG